MLASIGERARPIAAACLTSAAAAGPTPIPFTNLALYNGADGARSIAVVDIDGDGDLDIFVASANDNRVAWLENDGLSPPTFTHRLITGSATGAQQVIAVDLNGDGRLDAVSAAFGADRVSWHQNNAGAADQPPTFTPRTITSNAVGAQGVAAADLNGDGLLDVAAASFSDNKVAWHQQVPVPGEPPMWTSRTISTGVSGASAIVAADIDLDGDVDLLAAAYTTNRVVWLENTPGAAGAPPVWIERTITSGATGVIGLHAADLDGDGDTDLVAACFGDNTVRLYENLIAGPGMGPPTFAAQTIDSAANGPVGVSSYDLDADGDLDILSTSLFGNAVAWHERTPGALPQDPPAFIKHIVATQQGSPRAVVGADLDADGDRDLVSCSQNNDRVTLHDNALPRVFNLNSGAGFQTVTEALAAAANNDVISVERPGWMARERSIDFAGRRARVQTMEPFVQSAGASCALADRATLASAPGTAMTLRGQTGAGALQRVTLEAAEVTLESGGMFTAGPGAFVEIDSAAALRIAGDMVVAGSLLSPMGVEIEAGGTLDLAGFASGPFEIGGELTVERDSALLGGASVGETGAIRVTGAALTIEGALALEGELALSADPSESERALDGLTVQGNLTAGTGATLRIGAGATLEAPANLDLAIDDPARFEVLLGAIRIVGSGARTFEVMSANTGADASGLDPSLPGRFPIGSLVIEAGATLDLADAHDNDGDGQGVAEALYIAGELRIEAGGSLNVGAHRVFYGELTNLGTIDHPNNLNAIGSCPGDITGDLFVGFADLNVIVSHFNEQGPPGTLVGDIDGDGLVGFSDLNVVVSAFNTDC